MPKRHKTKTMTTAQSEPALARGLVVAVLALLGSLGVGWATEVDATLLTGVVIAAIALGQAVWTRFASTANAKVVTRVTTSGQVVAGDAAAAPTGTVLEVMTHNRSYPVVAPTAVAAGLVTQAE